MEGASGSLRDDPKLVFRSRPKPVPGDLRIIWRLSLTLLALSYCRGRRASFAKMHVLNSALTSEATRKGLTAWLEGSRMSSVWEMRVEPAFSRNLDFLVGAGLARWRVLSGRLSIELTKRGQDAASIVAKNEEVFSTERGFLETAGKAVTEARARDLVNLKGVLE